MDTNQFGIKGIGPNVQLGKAGPRLLNNSNTALEAKNAANNALVIMRGLNGVGATDFATIAQLPSIVGELSSRAVSLSHSDADTINIGLPVPALCSVFGVLINVSEVFNGTTPTLSIGIAGTVSQLMATTEIDLTTIAIYGGFVFKAYTPATQLIATLTLAGGPTTGECDVLVLFASA